MILGLNVTWTIYVLLILVDNTEIKLILPMIHHFIVGFIQYSFLQISDNNLIILYFFSSNGPLLHTEALCTANSNIKLTDTCVHIYF